jgi:hypothetical protein
MVIRIGDGGLFSGLIVGPSERIENRPGTRCPEPLPEPAGALQYIRSNTPPEDSDLLHGLCLYSELWLSKVGSFLCPATLVHPSHVVHSDTLDF